MTARTGRTVNAVLRIPKVTLSRASLEITVGPVDRFDVSEANGTIFAQINAPEDCEWSDVLAVIERVGPALLGHVEREEVGQPSLDVAFFIQNDRASASLLVPNKVVRAVGRFGIDLEVSAYVEGPEDFFPPPPS